MSRADAFPDLHLKRLSVENVKAITMVVIEPNGPGLVLISGANGSGKSSLCDSLEYGLCGERFIPSEPIRIGAESARTLIDLDAITVTREFYREPDPDDPDDDGSRIMVETKAGARVKSPQSMLNDVWTQRAMDPVHFCEGLTAKEQLAVLRGLVDLPIDLDALDVEIEEAFTLRTGVGRDAKTLKARFDAYTIGPDWPEHAVDVSALLAEMTVAAEHNRELEKQAAYRLRDAQMIQNYAKSADEIRVRAVELRRQADELDRQQANTWAAMKSAEEELAALPPLAEPRDLATCRARVEEANELNEKHRLRTEWRALEQSLAEKEEEHETLTGLIESKRALRDTTIANATFPVPGLAFGDGEVLYNGLPLAQASSAQRILVACGIMVARNPKLKLIIIKQASLLDTEARAAVHQFAQEKGYVVLGEVVDQTGKVGIYLEAGRVVKVNGDAAGALL